MAKCVQRVCILGATGSVGTSTLDVVARHPERFEVFALTAHRRARRAARAVPALAARASPSLRAAAEARALRGAAARRQASRPRCLCGAARAVRAGRASGSRHRHGRDRRRRRPGAVPGGRRAPASACCSPTRKRWSSAARCSCAPCASGGATLLPIDSEHSAIFQCLPGGPRAPGTSASTTSCSRPRAGRSATAIRRRCAQRDARRGLRAPELGHGPQDLGRLGDDDEQGARGHRGALAVRPRARADPGRHPSAEHHPLDGRVPRQLGAGAARHARHARADRLRPGVSGAHRVGRRRARLAHARARSTSSRPTCALPGPAPGLGRAAGAAPAATAVLNAANEEAVAAFLDGTIRFDRIHTRQLPHRRGARARPGARPTRSRRCSRWTRERGAPPAEARWLVRRSSARDDHHRTRLPGHARRPDRRPRVRPLPRRRGLRRQGAALLGRLRPRLWRRQRAPEAPSSWSRRCRWAATCACSTSAKATVAPHEARPAFNRKPLWQRAAIVAAGPAANLLLAVLLYAAAHWIGVDEPKAVLGAPVAGSMAERAGLRAGDWVRALVARTATNGATCAR